MDKIDVETMKVLILDSHKNNPDDTRASDPKLEDFAKIGSLMTDEAACKKHLKTLNDELLLHAGQRGLLSKLVKKNSQTLKDLPNNVNFKNPIVVNIDRVVNSFFEAFEGQYGFNNNLLTASDMPSFAPTLTEFVDPPSFREYLFKYGYHWKDPGVGWGHGEYTHRIHWYMVIKQNEENGAWLKHTPIQLFRACADQIWLHGKNKNAQTGIWDDLFDNFGVGDFRKAENLHDFLWDASYSDSPNHAEIWFLSQLIMGRAKPAQKNDDFLYGLNVIMTSGNAERIQWAQEIEVPEQKCNII